MCRKFSTTINTINLTNSFICRHIPKSISNICYIVYIINFIFLKKIVKTTYTYTIYLFMPYSAEFILIIGSFLLLVATLSSKISTKLGIPILLLFLAVGMLAGPDGIGKIQFESASTAKIIGCITLTLILFSGGLETKFSHVKPILWNGVLLSTSGILITAFSLGYFIYLCTDFTLLEGLLVGSIVSSTDAAAVFSILRSRNIHLKNNLCPTLELESGSNDAMAYFLTVFLSSLIAGTTTFNFWGSVIYFLKDMSIGMLVGIFIGKIMAFLINKIKLDYDMLYPTLTLSIIILTYSATNFIHGNGFLAVYIAGIILGNKNFIHKKSLIKFYEGISWLMQIVMFVVLGLLVYPKKLVTITGIGLLASAFLMFIARPASVFLSLAFNKIDVKQKIFLSWVGLRGAVPIVFAIYPLTIGLEKSDTIFHIVFFIVLTSVLLQGTTLYPLAKFLKLEEKQNQKKKKSLIFAEDEIKNELIEIKVPKNASAQGKQIVDLTFPSKSLVVLINRNNQYITPRGDTYIMPNDVLTIMMDDKKDIEIIKKKLAEI